jgi:predicted DNA repair protein MutK
VSIPHGKGKGGKFTGFEGISKFNDKSTAESLHEAIQNAAKAAATHLKLSGSMTADFEVSRIQIVVGNPNVKVYRVVITPSA